MRDVVGEMKTSEANQEDIMSIIIKVLLGDRGRCMNKMKEFLNRNIRQYGMILP